MPEGTDSTTLIAGHRVGGPATPMDLLVEVGVTAGETQKGIQVSHVAGNATWSLPAMEAAQARELGRNLFRAADILDDAKAPSETVYCVALDCHFADSDGTEEDDERKARDYAARFGLSAWLRNWDGPAGGNPLVEFSGAFPNICFLLGAHFHHPDDVATWLDSVAVLKEAA